MERIDYAEAMTSENTIEALEEALDSLDNVLDRLEEVRNER